MSAQDHSRYVEQIRALFPRGAAWPEARGPVWDQLLAALAPECARIDGRAEAALLESDPRTCAETLEDWERVLGLPDPCLGLDQTEPQRRAMVIATLLMRGGASPAYFEALGALFQRPCGVSEEFPPVCGFAASGDGLAEEWQDMDSGRETGGFLLDSAAPFHWWVKSTATEASVGRAGDSAAGDALLDFGDRVIECVIQRFKPSHTAVHHHFDGAAAVATLGG